MPSNRITSRVLPDPPERAGAILDAASDAIITTDLNGVIVDSNAAAAAAFGYSEKELAGMSFSKLIPLRQREQYFEDLARFRETGLAHITGIETETTGKRKDGSTFPAELSLCEVMELGLITGIIRDITDRVLTRESLRSEHEFNEKLIETTPIIILVLDCQGRIIRYNPILEQISGRALKETQDCDWFDVFLPDRDKKKVREVFLDTLATNSTQGYINPIVTESGEEREVEWYSTPLRDAAGSVVGLLCNGVDVTERLLLEKLVYQASEEEKIRIAQELHDGLGSLLTGVSYYTAALSERLRQGKQITVADTEQIVENLKEAITQTRTLSHGLNGLNDRPNALLSALEKLATQVRVTSRMKCRFHPSVTILEITDSVAANHVLRIAQEAVSNAIRHGGATCLTIRIEPEADGWTKLVITDNGRGITPMEASGEGIGLNTMKCRARAIGAKLTINRRPKNGTKVECIFPSQ